MYKRQVPDKTNNKKLEKQAEAQKKKLNKLDPQGRYVVVTTPGNDGSVPVEGMWKETIRLIKNFFTNRPVGSYTILRTSDINESGISHLKVSKETLINPDFIKSYDMDLAYLKQLSFEEKLELFDDLKNKNMDQLYATGEKFQKSALYNAIISDLAEEQSLVKKSGKGELQKLKMLSDYKFTSELPKSGLKLKFISELTADLYHMAKVCLLYTSPSPRD